MKKAQTFSLDALTALAVFMIVLISFVFLISFASSSKRAQDLNSESQFIADKIVLSSGGSECNMQLIKEGKELSNEMLHACVEVMQEPDGYEKLKAALGTDKDFCIYITRQGSSGKTEVLQLSKTEEIYGIGSGKVIINASDGTEYGCGEVRSP